MCHAVTCRRCGRPSWEGCGLHIEQALADVPVEERCRCDASTEGAAGAAGPPTGWRRFIGR